MNRIDQGAANARKLDAASALILEVLGTLNATTTLCEACGRLHPDDRVEHRAFEALSQMRLKLQDWAETLALPPTEREASSAARRNAGLMPRSRGRR
jgi:hypothetical protein